VGQADIFKLRNNCQDIESKIQVCTQKSVELINSIKDFKQHKRDIVELLEMSEQIELLGSSFTLNYTEHKEAFRRDALIDVIKSVQIRLSKKEQTRATTRRKCLQNFDKGIVTHRRFDRRRSDRFYCKLRSVDE
jgi:hypothetical protein